MEMRPSLIVLKLVAEALGIDLNTPDDVQENHDVLQYAIYLLQASGLPLGYGYGWYR